MELQPLNGYAASAEALVPDVDEPPDGVLAALSAAGLARLVELAPRPGSVPSLMPSPSWVGWDHTEPGLWPTSDDVDVDSNTTRNRSGWTGSQQPSATACAPPPVTR